MNYSVAAVLRDGTTVLVRALAPADRPGLVDLFNRLSPRSVYFRFFHVKQRLTEADLSQLTEVDFRNEVSLAVTIAEAGGERIVGVGRYAAGSGGKRAEVNFTVADEHQRRGIGKLLLEHLVAIAQKNGITEIEAYVLADNSQMLRVFLGGGFRVTRRLEEGVYHLTSPIVG